MFDFASAFATPIKADSGNPHLHAGWRKTSPCSPTCIIGLKFFIFWYIDFSDSSSKIMAPNSPMKDIGNYIICVLTTVATQIVSNFFRVKLIRANESKALNTLAQRGQMY